jgi:choline dehydrogenase
MECDFLVVGAGASGSAIAGRLSENIDNSVIVAEAGGWDTSPFLRLPGLGFYASAIPRYNWNFTSDPISELNDKRIPLLQGKVLGGSSSINGMIFTRGHSSEYDKWVQMGCSGWGFEDLLPYFLKLENNFRGAGKWHGDKGPIRLRRANPNLPICDAFLESASSAGLPVVNDLNANHPEGVGWYDVNINNGLRVSASQAYLRSTLKKKI